MGYETWAHGTVSVNWIVVDIVTACNGTDAVLNGTTLYVENVTQAALDAAIAAYSDSTAQVAARWASVRTERDSLLAASDWTQLADVPSTVNAAAWATYRQALRDIPQSQSDPTNITWPTHP